MEEEDLKMMVKIRIMDNYVKDERITLRISEEEKCAYTDALMILGIRDMSKDLIEHIRNRIQEAEEFKQRNKM